MPKLKTHKGTKRRIRVTARGKLVHMQSGRRHLLTGKRSRKMRHLRRWTEVPKALKKKLQQLLPYR